MSIDHIAAALREAEMMAAEADRPAYLINDGRGDVCASLHPSARILEIVRPVHYRGRQTSPAQRERNAP